MGTDLPRTRAPIGATHRLRRNGFVIIRAASLSEIHARDLRAGRQSTRRGKRVSTPSDDDVKRPTFDVGRPSRPGESHLESDPQDLSSAWARATRAARPTDSAAW